MKAKSSSRAKKARLNTKTSTSQPAITAAQTFASIPEMLLALFTCLDSSTTFHSLRLVSHHFNTLANTYQSHILSSIAHNAFPPHIHYLLDIRRPGGMHPLQKGLWDYNLGGIALDRKCDWHLPLLFYPDIDPRPGHFSITGRELERLEREYSQMNFLAKRLAREIERTHDWDDRPVTVRATKKLIERIKEALYLLFYLLCQLRITGIADVAEKDLNSLSKEELEDREKEEVEITYDFSAAEEMGVEGLLRVVNLARMLTTLGRDEAFRRGFPGKDILSCEDLEFGGWGGADELYERAKLKVFAAVCLVDVESAGLEENKVRKLRELQRTLFEDLYFHPKDFKKGNKKFLKMRNDSGMVVYEPGGTYNKRILERKTGMVLEADGVWREKEVLEMREDWQDRLMEVEKKLIQDLSFEWWLEVAMEEQESEASGSELSNYSDVDLAGPLAYFLGDHEFFNFLDI